MDQQQWKHLRVVIVRAARRVPKEYRLKYSEVLIVSMYFWAVQHDRCMTWACDRRNYNSVFRPRRLPSVSQFNRRMKCPRVFKILQIVGDQLAENHVTPDQIIVDGKALTVNNVSKDPDVRCGYVSGKRLGKGYKLHATTSGNGRILSWIVRPLNEHEVPQAMRMIDQLPQVSPETILLADGNYDWHDFHKFSHAHGIRLMTHLRGKARHPVTLRQMGEARRELIKLHDHHPQIIRSIMKQRTGIERTLAHLCGGDGGLRPLPPFVRRLPRVTRWVGVKIALYHLRRKSRLRQVNADG